MSENLPDQSANGKVGAVMVLGAGVAGIQSALDLGDMGYKVYLVEEKPSIGGAMAQLDKTFPTNDCAMCLLSPKLVDVARHPNIEIITNADLVKLEGKPGRFSATLNRRARGIDVSKCTGCGDCAEACPVSMPDEFNYDLSPRKAVYRFYPQAVPAAFVIDRKKLPRCKQACPAGTPAQGYVALVAEGRHEDAYRVLREAHPFPAVCGRVCHHPCEGACERGVLDAPVSIRALKRFVADRAAAEGWAGKPYEKIDREQAESGKVAIVGAGPAGLTAALALCRLGHQVTVLEALDVPGGMLRTGIPDYRLPPEVLNSEIEAISSTGVEIRTGCALGRDVSLADLKRDYRAVLLACGCPRGLGLRIPGEDLQGVQDSIEFLRRANLGDPELKVPERVGVVGGGNAAIDAARTARRMGAASVTIYYRRSRAEMPAYSWEIEEALEEGVEIEFLVAPVEAVGAGGELKTVRMVRMELGAPDQSGRRRPVPIEGSEFEVECDLFISAIGQQTDLGFVSESDGLKVTRWGTPEADPLTLQTSVDGLFSSGDMVSGAATVVEAIAAGKRAAVSIDNYVQGRALDFGQAPSPAALPRLSRDDVERPAELVPRTEETAVAAGERVSDFREIVAAFSEEEAQREAARCLSCGPCSGCALCEAACKADAVRREQVGGEETLEVGAVILAPGYDRYYPTNRLEYSYGRSPNVVTAPEFERMLSASGPYAGHLVRPSDGKEPERIAFIQCVGSRDLECNAYCSGVCCMHATKEAIVAKEHSEKPLETDIYFMDMRAFGKGFDRYYERAKSEYKVRYRRCRLPVVEQAPGSDDLLLGYLDEGGKLQKERYDIVVLSTALIPPKGVRGLAGAAGLALNKYDFIDTRPFASEDTSREGVMVCGAASEPKDIPETVIQASAAAARAAEQLAEVRGTLVAEKEYPPERDVSDEPLRIGVFVCHCGLNIGGIVNVEEVVEFAATLPGVAHAEHSLYTCSQDNQQQIKERIKERGLNRVVIASCTPRTHEALFQDTIREVGLNPMLLEFVSIREHCSWVHMNDKPRATAKAKDLVGMAVSKAGLLRPVPRPSFSIRHEALVAGGGMSGMTAALSLAEQGFEVHLVEKEKELGGNLRKLRFTLSGDDPQELLGRTIERVEASEKIHVHLSTHIESFTGYMGNYQTTLVGANGQDGQTVIEHGAVIVATGAAERQTDEYLRGQSDRVITQKELEAKLADEAERPSVTSAGTVAMIQCVGSREEGSMYCSRVCCANAIKNALKIKELSPETSVVIFYRDIRTYGFREEYYQKARQAGVIFVRYEPEKKPKVAQGEAEGAPLRIEAFDPVLGQALRLDVDWLVLSTGMVPAQGSVELAKTFKVPLDQDGFFLEAHIKLRPVDFATDGVYLCGLAHCPKFLGEAISQARAAAARAATLVAQESVQAKGRTAEIKERLCAGCGVCVGVCPYGAREIDPEKGIARVIEVLCQGCGACGALCPNAATKQVGFAKEDILAAVDSLT